MSIDSFAASLYRLRRTTDQFAISRRDLDDLQRQLATGKKTDSYGGLGAARGLSLDGRGRLAAIEGWKATIADVDLRLRLTSGSIEALTKLSESTKSDLASPAFDLDADGRSSVQVTAEQRLKQAIDELNNNIDGRYLFAGRASDRKPVASAELVLNGDPASGRAGLRQLIAEREQAELGANGLGRLTLSANATGVQLAGEATNPPFGLRVVAASGSGSIGASFAAGPPASASFNLAALPADGDSLTVTLADQDGASYTLTLTARAGAGGSDSFQIGGSIAATVANLNTALDAAVRSQATAALKPRAAVLAAADFFAGSAAAPPQRVAGPPFTSATAIVAGTAANTVIWYNGDDAPAAGARATVPAKVDSGETVATGAQANEPAMTRLLAQLGALAATSFAATGADRSAHAALADRVRTNLSPANGTQKLADIGADLGLAAAAIDRAKSRHAATQNLIETAMADTENANPDEIGAAILSLQTRLQASYQATAILSRLSLTDFL